MLKNNSLHKDYIKKIGYDQTLQSLIEIMDDSVHKDINNGIVIPIWKFKFIETLESAYDIYMESLK